MTRCRQCNAEIKQQTGRGRKHRIYCNHVCSTIWNNVKRAKARREATRGQDIRTAGAHVHQYMDYGDGISVCQSCGNIRRE